jgi:hypothetical protein
VNVQISKCSFSQIAHFLCFFHVSKGSHIIGNRIFKNGKNDKILNYLAGPKNSPKTGLLSFWT